MKKTNQRKPGRKTAVRKRRPDAADLIRTADALGLKLYAVEGLTNFRQRAREAIKRMEENGFSLMDGTLEDHILTCQYFRESGFVDPDIIFAWIDEFADNIVHEDAEIKRLLDANEAKHREAGFAEGETWPDEKPPADVQRLWDAYWERYRRLNIAVLRHHGEDEMADLLENDSDAYDARLEAGQALAEKFHADRVAGKGTPGQVK